MTPGPKKGFPQKRSSAFVGEGGAGEFPAEGRNGARERAEFSPKAETEQSGLCDDAVEEARAELYHEQAEELRGKRIATAAEAASR